MAGFRGFRFRTLTFDEKIALLTDFCQKQFYPTVCRGFLPNFAKIMPMQNVTVRLSMSGKGFILKADLDLGL